MYQYALVRQVAFGSSLVAQLVVVFICSIDLILVLTVNTVDMRQRP